VVDSGFVANLRGVRAKLEVQR
jgi:hypothetical protein